MSAIKLGEFHPFRSAEARDRYLSRYDKTAKTWPIASETRMVHTDAGETLVRIGGPSDAPPLVLLAGSWSNSLGWIPMIEEFSQSFRTYAVDNICDFGRSVCSRPIKGAEDFTQWLDGLFDALGLVDGINLMGWSRGSWLTAEYALHAPDRLAAAVLHSPGGVVLVDYLEGIASLPRVTAALSRPSSHTLGAMMRHLMPDLARMDELTFEEAVEDMAMGLQCFDRRVVGKILGPRVFSDAELRSIDVPTLYIAGENETIHSPEKAVARLNSVVPHWRTAIIQGAGHDVGLVETEAYTSAVLSFLRAQ